MITKIQTVSGIYEGRTIEAISIGNATAAVRIRVFIYQQKIFFDKKPAKKLSFS